MYMYICICTRFVVYNTFTFTTDISPAKVKSLSLNKKGANSIKFLKSVIDPCFDLPVIMYLKKNESIIT